MLLRSKVLGQRIARGERGFSDRTRAIGKTGTGLLQGLKLLRLLRLLLLRLREEVRRARRRPRPRPRARSRARVAAIAAVALMMRRALHEVIEMVLL